MSPRSSDPTRRQLLRAGLGLLGGAAVPPLFARAARSATADALAGSERHPERILVVLELAGGNDGLNTVVPTRNDAYYAARPKLGLARDDCLALDSEFGLHPRMQGVKNLWDRGQVAIVHGCGYPQPDRSHFTSMRYWHTATPHSANPRGWIGRFADARWPDGPTGALVNLGPQESLAVRSFQQAPISFEEPERYVRNGDPRAAPAYQALLGHDPGRRDTLDFVRHVARTARETQRLVREATEGYETPVSYGVPFPTVSRDLRNVAALIAADFPARIYTLSFSGFDTHSDQLGRQNLLLQYLADALEGFHKDLVRLGRDRDVLVMAYSEFGRRVAENRSGGTDHGAAGTMWLFGRPVRPGFHGRFPSLTELDDGDLAYTTDFRRVYATALQWMGQREPSAVLGEGFEPLAALRG